MLARVVSMFVVAAVMLAGQVYAGTLTPIFSFDDMTVNANSDTVAQSSASWVVAPYNSYGADNYEGWKASAGSMSFYRYVVWDNTSHMGYPYYGFLEIDNKVSLKGNALKCTVTGGNNASYSSGTGLKVSNKSQYVAQKGSSYSNAVVGDPYLYFLANRNWSPNSPPQQTFPMASSNANRLSIYVKAPAGFSVDRGGKRPQETWSVGPYSNKGPTGATSTGGHFYHDIPVGGGGWAKLQLDNHPRYHNSGGMIHRNIPGYIPAITGFYITGANYEGQVMTPYSLWVDEIQFEYDDYAQQNNETINSLSVSYNETANTWEAGFHDKYQDHVYYNKAKSTYEIRYSFSPITNENWAAATPAAIQAYPGFGIEARSDGRFKRASNDDYLMVWCRFKLATAADDAAFAARKTIYFAVKDISQDPANLRSINPALTGTLAGQGRDYSGAASVFDDYATDATNLPYIKRITYSLGAASEPATVPDTVAPSVAISSPAANAAVTGTVPVSVIASDAVGVTRVEYFVNNVLKETDTTTPYVYSWDTASLASGNYVLLAKAYDAAGNVGQSSVVSVSVITDVVAPAVTLLSPVANAVVSGMLTVSASASDNVGVNRIEYYANGVLLSATNVTPYQYAWDTTTLADGSCTLTAVAYDAANNAAQSTPVVVVISNTRGDTTAPTAAVTSPAAGATLSGTVTISATAADNIGVTRVEFYVNGALSGTSTAPPYAVVWNSTAVANGSCTITARAYDANGNAGASAAVSAVVANILPDTVAPSVSITSPYAYATVSRTVTVRAAASDNTAVSKVEFYVNGILKATDTDSPYSYAWNTAAVSNGAYVLTVRAYDAAGNMKQSAARTVTVKNIVADTTAPAVSVVSPLPNSTVSKTVTAAVSASDNVGVTKVEFYVNGWLDRTITTAPFSYSVSTGVADNGNYTMYAKAYDAAGNVKQSATITFTIKN